MGFKNKMSSQITFQWPKLGNLLDQPAVIALWSEQIKEHGDPFVPKDATLQFGGIGGSFPETDRSVTINSDDDHVTLVGNPSFDGDEFYSDDELHLLAQILVSSIASVRGLDASQCVFEK